MNQDDPHADACRPTGHERDPLRHPLSTDKECQAGRDGDRGKQIQTGGTQVAQLPGS
ncbi:MAG: hypothetical protein QOJ19_4006, partial [Acidimicrobiia bacterium]|nr:hypothetical protein [Acidimicrobiia bacterium]